MPIKADKIRVSCSFGFVHLLVFALRGTFNQLQCFQSITQGYKILHATWTQRGGSSFVHEEGQSQAASLQSRSAESWGTLRSLLEDFPMPRISAIVAVLTLLLTTGAVAQPKDQNQSEPSAPKDQSQTYAPKDQSQYHPNCYSQHCYEECSAVSKNCENICEQIASTKPPCK